jgi:hypothetical protein
MSTVEELVNKGNSTLGLITSTLLIISFQAVALIPLLLIPLEPLMTQSLVIYPTNMAYIVAYFAIPLIFYIGASLLLNPKRIISPLYAQIGTIAIITIILTFRASTTSIHTSDQMSALVQSLFQTISFWAMLLVEGGVIQLLFVRWVIRLSFDSIDRESYFVEGKSPQEVVSLLGKSFLNAHHFEKPRQQGSVWITKRFDPRSKSSLIIAIGEQVGAPKNCIIATIAFRRGMYVIKRDKAASDIRDEMFDNIKGKLLTVDPNVRLIKLSDETLNDDASSVAYEEARDVTISRLGAISEKARDIPLYYKVLIGGTLIALVALVLAQLIGYGNFTELIATVIIALVLEIGLPLRDELREQLSKRETRT